MLITEWNTEEAKEVWFEEGREEGIRYTLGLFDQGFSVEEIKRRLEKPSG